MNKENEKMVKSKKKESSNLKASRFRENLKEEKSLQSSRHREFIAACAASWLEISFSRRFNETRDLDEKPIPPFFFQRRLSQTLLINSIDYVSRGLRLQLASCGEIRKRRIDAGEKPDE